MPGRVPQNPRDRVVCLATMGIQGLRFELGHQTPLLYIYKYTTVVGLDRSDREIRVGTHARAVLVSYKKQQWKR